MNKKKDYFAELLLKHRKLNVLFAPLLHKRDSFKQLDSNPDEGKKKSPVNPVLVSSVNGGR